MDLARYPTLTRVLADVAQAAPPLQDLSPDKKEWDNFKQISNRPAKRLGVEFKTYIEFHRDEFPSGKKIKASDLKKVMNLSEKELGRIPMIFEYLVARRYVRKTKQAGVYEVD